jgi:hypothetical protein
MRPFPALRSGFLAILLVTLPGCNDLGPSGPEGRGSINVDLMSPNGAEGAAVFELTGGTGLGVVSSFGGEVYYEHNYGTGITRVVVVMDVPGNVQFKVRTSNVGDLPSATVLQVADGNDQLRSSLDGYEVEVIPVADRGGS